MLLYKVYMGDEIKLTCVDSQKPKQIDDRKMLFPPTDVTL